MENHLLWLIGQSGTLAVAILLMPSNHWEGQSVLALPENYFLCLIIVQKRLQKMSHVLIGENYGLYKNVLELGLMSFSGIRNFILGTSGSFESMTAK